MGIQEAINKQEKNKQKTMNFSKNLIVATIAVVLVSSSSVSAGHRFLQTPEEEAPTTMPILSGVSTPTEAPTEMAILNGDVDENGCIPSAGYSWCPSLEECIRSFETDCPPAAPTDSPILPGSDRDENGCIPSAGYSWCDPLKECIKSWETDCPGTTNPSPTKSPIQDSTPSPTKSPVQGPTPSSPTAPLNPAAEAQATETAVINNDVKVEVSSAALLTSSMMGMAAVTTAFVAMA